MNISNNIKVAAKYIREGKLDAFPKETVYGLGSDALNPLAVEKYSRLKSFNVPRFQERI